MESKSFTKTFPHVGLEFRTGHGARNGPKALSALTASWHQVLTEYTRVETDLGYWYNERATLSTLAGAAWRLGQGSLALEEYSTLRNKKKGDPKKGRCDLWLDLNGFRVVIEAKAYWPKTPNQTIIEREVSERLDAAATQVRELAENEPADWYLFSCFVAPWIAASKAPSASAARTMGREFWSCLHGAFGGDGHYIDVYECPISLLDGVRRYYEHDRIVPGVALVVGRHWPE